MFSDTESQSSSDESVATSDGSDASQVHDASATTKSSNTDSHQSQASKVCSHAPQVNGTSSVVSSDRSSDAVAQFPSQDDQATSDKSDASQVNHTSVSSESS